MKPSGVYVSYEHLMAPWNDDHLPAMWPKGDKHSPSLDAAVGLIAALYIPACHFTKCDVQQYNVFAFSVS